MSVEADGKATVGSKVRRTRVAFVLEQTLGHVTHSDNLRSLLADHAEIDIEFLPIRLDPAGWLAKLPGLSNWTIRAGLGARRAVRNAYRRQPIDALFIHTQVPAVLLGSWMRKIPSIVSLDATPIQFDTFGEYYRHGRSLAAIEWLKTWANKRALQRAKHVVVWSEWTRQSVVDDYGVEAGRVSVIPPGVDVDRWSLDDDTYTLRDEVPHILFVGADLDRKGGRLLIEAAHRLRSDPDVGEFVLEIVTRTDVPSEPGITVHLGLQANSPSLIAAYHRASIFCLPTFADCLALVLSEAGIAELALVSTDVGAISEIVRDGETGLLVPPGDVAALTEALKTLLLDPAKTRRMGAAAAELVRKNYSAAVNADRLVSLLRSISSTH